MWEILLAKIEVFSNSLDSSFLHYRFLKCQPLDRKYKIFYRDICYLNGKGENLHARNLDKTKCLYFFYIIHSSVEGTKTTEILDHRIHDLGGIWNKT